MIDIDKVANRLQSYKQLQKLLDAHETKTDSIALRKKWIQRQKHNNYMNEYNRVRGELSKSCLLYTSPSPRDRTRSRMPSSA